MPTVITTSTAATSTAYGNQRKVDRTSNGVLWAVYNEGSGYAFRTRYSTDDGATWTDGGSVGSSGSGNTYVANASFFIDVDDYAHVVYKDNANGIVYYRRGTPNAARTGWTWSSATALFTITAMGYPDVVAHKEGTGWVAHVVTSRPVTNSDKATYSKVTIDSAGTVSAASPVYLAAGGGGGIDSWPSIDFNHTGDGKTVAGGTPHLYVAWSDGAAGAGNGIRFKKATYSAGSWTWGTEREIDSTRYVNNMYAWSNCLFDGTRVIIPGWLTDSGGNVDLVLHERDAADTTTTTRVLIDNTTSPDYIRTGSATYDGEGNVYLAGLISTVSPYPVGHRKWTRSSATLGAAVTVDSDTNTGPHVSLKRGYSDQRIEFIYTDGTASPYSVTYDGLSLNAPPNAPTLVAPTNGATIDLSVATLFDWTFSDPDAGDTQSAWAFRRKLSGAPSYEYWNAGTSAWQSTEVWNSGSTSEYTFAAGSWANGNIYNWSVATKDAAGAVGPYAGDWTVTGGQPPSVTVDAPTGTVVISRPNVQWTFSDPAGGTQVTYHLKVYDSATYSDAGFDPNSTTALHDTGEVSDSSTRIRTIQEDLQTGTTYRAYMRVKDDEGIYSQWAYSQFTVSLSPPNVPTITVTDDPDNARVLIDVQGHDNLLTENQASLETDTTGWTAIARVAIARSTAQAADGVASLQMTTNTIDGGIGGYRAAPSPRTTVVGGQQYTAQASFRAAATGRSVGIWLNWHDAAGALISQATNNNLATDTTTGWTAVTLTAVAPSNAASVDMQVVFGAATVPLDEVHYVDKIALIPGNVTTWARGGLAASTAFIVERSLDGGITWEPVRGTETGQVHDGAPTQKLRVLDREIGPGTTPTYRAKTTVEV